MAWTDSRIFKSYLEAIILQDIAMDYDNVIKAALYNGTITPNHNAIIGPTTCYNGGVWVTANEVWEAVEWPQGGMELDVDLDNTVDDFLTLTSDDTSSGTTADLANVYGCLIYDSDATPTKQGMCYNYFGGANTVVNGTFTIRWSANGIMRFAI